MSRKKGISKITDKTGSCIIIKDGGSLEFNLKLDKNNKEHKQLLDKLKPKY
jgi:hypothetical protein